MNNWISSKDEAPRKDIPIIIIGEYFEMPTIVIWYGYGTQGDGGFIEGNGEFEINESDILYWMPAPHMPEIK
jgi:hypothetical protein